MLLQEMQRLYTDGKGQFCIRKPRIKVWCKHY